MEWSIEAGRPQGSPNYTRNGDLLWLPWSLERRVIHMHIRHHSSFWLSFSAVCLLLALVVAACGSPNAGAGNGASLKKVSIGLGYIPDIQFAPFYVAQSKGYYKAAGLNVDFHHGFVNDLIGSLAVGHDTFVFASGDEELVARSKNISVVNVATIYQRYSVSLIVPA